MLVNGKRIDGVPSVSRLAELVEGARTQTSAPVQR
jgi:hypothetical protein